MINSKKILRTTIGLLIVGSCYAGAQPAPPSAFITINTFPGGGVAVIKGVEYELPYTFLRRSINGDELTLKKNGYRERKVRLPESTSSNNVTFYKGTKNSPQGLSVKLIAIGG